MKKNIKIILAGLLLIICLFIFSLNKNISLEMLKNTNLSDNKKIETILKKIDYGNSEFEFSVKSNKIIINYNIEFFDYKTLEKNSSILFYLLNDLDEIEYSMNDGNYIFYDSKIENIYEDFSNITIKTINKRYDTEYFSYIYLGNINGNIDIFDTSDLCLENYLELYRDDNYIYYITCSDINDVIVVDSGKEFTLLEALDKKIILVDDLFDTNIKIKKDGIDV